MKISKFNLNFFKTYLGEVVYLLAQYTTPLVSLFVNVFIMRFMAPEELGLYQGILLWAAYLVFLQLGLFNGLNRNLSHYKGVEDFEKYQLAVNSGFGHTVVISIVSLLTSLFIGFNLELSTNNGYLAFTVLCFTSFLQPYAVFLDTLYRTGQDFKKLGKILLIDNFLILISSSLVVFLGYLGYVLQSISKVLVGFVLRYKGKHKSFSFDWKFGIIKEQIDTGFLLMVNGYLYTVFFLFDQFYIVRNFSEEDLGHFNIARLVLLILPIVPNSMTTILYPKASFAYGKSNNNKNILKNFFYKSLIANIIIILPIVMLLYLFLPLVIEYFLPEYSEGIEYALSSVWGGLGFIVVGPSVILGVLKKNTFNLILLIFITLLTYGLYVVGGLQFDVITDLIWYKNLLFIAYALIILFYIYFILHHDKK